MKKLGVIFAVLVVIVFALSAFANNNPNNNNNFDNEITINNGLETFREEVCVDGFGNKTCTENTYIKCNGEVYNVPKPTGFTIYKSIIEKEFVEKGGNSEILNNKEKRSPSDRIKESDLEVFNNKIIINIKSPDWRKFIDSNSMDPLIDENSTTIEISPKNPDEIKIGDIISYDVDEFDYALVHRVVEIGNDEEGIYFITKGDNYFKNDPYKVRFGQIEGIVVGILY
ncbi:signal peptidase I [Candidatus Woesearchaeota archaeon]|nr:signal peptidase I [Candidatus Woesearchaeota archaeon]